jgi:hypothetical protein
MQTILPKTHFEIEKNNQKRKKRNKHLSQSFHTEKSTVLFIGLALCLSTIGLEKINFAFKHVFASK